MQTDELETLQRDHHPVINPAFQRFPYCIVWSPLPVITWIFPFIGHMGIADSNGIIHDFAGPYTIGKDQFAFGHATRYLEFELMQEGECWDTAIEQADEIYATRMHNLCCDNCHSHVAMALNLMKYQEYTEWNMITLCVKLFFQGRFTHRTAQVQTWLPFSCLVLGIVLLICLSAD